MSCAENLLALERNDPMGTQRILAVGIFAAALAGAALMMGQTSQPGAKPDAAQEQLITTAMATYVGYVEKMQIVALTPEFVEGHFLWSRRILEAELAVAKTPLERQKAALSHLDRMSTLQAKVKKRQDVDADKIVICQADYYVVDAEVAVARETR
jgi:hypothetical protein